VLALVALALVWTVVLTAPAGASSFGHCPASDALVCTQHSCYLPAACVSMQLRVAALWHSNGSAPGASSALAALALGDPVARLHLSARLGLPRATHPPTHCPAHRCRPCLYRHSVAHCPPGRASAPSTASAGRGADALCEPPALGAQLNSVAAARARRPARLVHRGGASDMWHVAAELAAEVAGLPGALQSGTPELLVDFLATVFKEGDGRPAPGCARTAQRIPASSPPRPVALTSGAAVPRLQLLAAVFFRGLTAARACKCVNGWALLAESNLQSCHSCQQT